MTERPYIPPHWPKDKPFPWMEWELTCPGCGRFHNNWHWKSGETSRCAWCDWTGYIADIHRNVTGEENDR